MRKVYWIALLSIILLDRPLYAIQWENSLERGLQKATQAGRPVFVDFFTDWCGWCKKLDMEVYPDANVQKLADQFVCIKIDCEKDKATAKRFNIEGFPTLILLNSQGKVLERIDGYVDKVALAEYMNQAIKKAGPPQKNIQASASPVSSPAYSRQQLLKAEQFYKLAQKMEVLGRKPQAVHFYSAAVKLAPDSDLARKAELRVKQLELE